MLAEFVIISPLYYYVYSFKMEPSESVKDVQTITNAADISFIQFVGMVFSFIDYAQPVYSMNLDLSLAASMQAEKV